MDKYDKLELCHTAIKEICGTSLKYFNQKNKIYLNSLLTASL